ncbi:hypothetical protein Sjap_015363 [Stephania japonica]|uniref:Uncharacterized protein n=1 Tax=Stephania japonica TaxID=461633 RepID=A0AAP0IKJ4_9MAGN
MPNKSKLPPELYLRSFVIKLASIIYIISIFTFFEAKTPTMSRQHFRENPKTQL